jgi:hypothetical protein
MNAGLPGIGISGVFYILSALFMPMTEAYRAARGRPRRRPWGAVLRHWAIAVAMIAAMYGTGRLLTFILRAFGHVVVSGSVWATVLLSIVPFVLVFAVIELFLARPSVSRRAESH